MCNGGLSLVSRLRDREGSDGEVTVPTWLSLWKAIRDLWAVKKPSSAKWAAYKTGNKTAVQRTAAAGTAGHKVQRYASWQYFGWNSTDGDRG